MGGDGGRGRLGLFITFFFLLKDCRGFSGMLINVRMVVIVSVIDVNI